MECIICSKEKIELAPADQTMIIDFDIGEKNDLEVECKKGTLEQDMYLICPNTEYGALIEEVNTWTDEQTEKKYGNTFRGFLKQFIIEPPSGQDYKIVSGDAHEIMKNVLDNAFDGMFSIPTEPSGITFHNYKFDRYTNALDGFSKMLKTENARINIEIQQGASNKPFSVVLSAVPIQNLSEEIEYSQESKIAIHLKESKRGINHLICLGKGELKDRMVIHLYVQFDGSISTSNKYFKGLKERTAIYENANAESRDDLIKGGVEQLQKLMSYKQMGMTVEDADLQIGDIVAGRDYDSGLYLQKPVTKKIVKISNGDINIEYKVEGGL